jgi:adenylate kinase
VVPGARLVILGKQGAGKGTQCARLARHYVVPHISTGDMLRAAARSATEFGQKAKQFMDAGELVPDEVMIGLVRERLDYEDTSSRGFILDGFPRTRDQAQALADFLGEDRALDLAIDIELPTEAALKRLAARRVCNVCGAIYSADQPPHLNWTCDFCGGEVVQREDDQPEAIKRRLDLYEEQTAPLIAWYLERDHLVTVDGMGPPDHVFQRLVHAIDARRFRR